MSPTDIEESARRTYNAVGDSFWSQEEIINDYLYEVCVDLSTYALCYEKTDSSTTTVSGTQEYSNPADLLRIKRVEYDGVKIRLMDFREQDRQDLDVTATDTGTPTHYYEWAESVGLYPVPDAAKTLKFYYYAVHPTITSASTLNIPVWAHHVLVDGVRMKMGIKEVGDLRFEKWQAIYYQGREWVRREAIKRRRGDRQMRSRSDLDLPAYYDGVV